MTILKWTDTTSVVSKRDTFSQFLLLLTSFNASKKFHCFRCQNFKIISSFDFKCDFIFKCEFILFFIGRLSANVSCFLMTYS